jgi:Holliday junction DNA helicase RuvA
MIGYLHGKVHSIGTDAIILETHGVGYRVFVPNQILTDSILGNELSVYVHTSVREDAITLFGFAHEADLVFFRQLLSVNGVGPKLALSILSGSSEAVKHAILEGDEAMLTRIPGIGKKTAGRIIIDLKGKVVPTSQKPRSIRDGSQDAVDALMNLGYDRGMVMGALADLPSEIKTTEDMVKYFLKNA